MKKLTVFFTLLLCVFFSEMSATTYPLSWERYGNNQLIIRVNGIEVKNVGSCATGVGVVYESGVLMIEEGAIVEVLGYSCNLANPLDVLVCEDGLQEYAAFYDYNYVNEEKSSFFESFTMPSDVTMYVWISNSPLSFP